MIRGAAINNDGAAKAGYTAPSVDGQAEVIATAQALAGVDPRTIGYVEAHGTATPLGDPIEIAALTQVFRASTEQRGFCAIGSVKANLGHLDAAAGVAGLIKTILALQHREIPPLPHFTAPNPQLALPTSPVLRRHGARAVAPGGRRRAARRSARSASAAPTRTSCSRRRPPPRPSLTHRSHSLLVLSAQTATALAAGTANVVEHLRANPATSIADVAYTLQVGRKVFQHRRSLVVQGAADAIEHAVATGTSAGHHRDARRRHRGRWRFSSADRAASTPGWAASLYHEEPRLPRGGRSLRRPCFAPQLGCDLRELLLRRHRRRRTRRDAAHPAAAVRDRVRAGDAVACAWGVRAAARCSATASASTSPRTSPA